MFVFSHVLELFSILSSQSLQTIHTFSESVCFNMVILRCFVSIFTFLKNTFIFVRIYPYLLWLSFNNFQNSFVGKKHIRKMERRRFTC